MRNGKIGGPTNLNKLNPKEKRDAIERRIAERKLKERVLAKREAEAENTRHRLKETNVPVILVKRG